MNRFPILAILLTFYVTTCVPVAVAAPPKRACVTTCGMWTTESGIDCRELRAYERRVLNEFADNVTPKWPGDAMCEGLKDWEIVKHRHWRFEVWPWCDLRNPATGCLLAYTYPETRTIEMDSLDLGEPTLAHEMVHVMQVRFSLAVGHCGWKDQGILKAIFNATGFWEDDEPCADGKNR